MPSTSDAGAAMKLANLQNGQEQLKKKSKVKKNITHGDSSPIPNGSINSIDHSGYYAVSHVPPVYPSTSAEVYDRRQVLRSIYSSKRSAPTTATKDRLAVKPSSSTLLPLKLLEKRPFHELPLLDHGRTPEREQIDNLREELHGIKRNYAIVSKENVALKTRLKRSGNEILKKDRQLQDLLLIQSKGFAPDNQKGNTIVLKQKVVALESLLKEKADEISRLKADREAMKVSDYREQITVLHMECNRLKRYLSYATPPFRLRTDVSGLSQKQGTVVAESNNARKLKEAMSLLEEENDRLRSKLQIFFNDSYRSSDELSALERDELIALIISLKTELKKTEVHKNNRITSKGSSIKHDATAPSAQKLVAIRRELEKTKEELRAKSAALEQLQRRAMKDKRKNINPPSTGKLTVPRVGAQKETRAEIMKIHSDDETEGRTESAVTVEASPKVTTPIEELEANDIDWENDEGSKSAPHETSNDAKTENLVKRLESISSEAESTLESLESVSKIPEHEEVEKKIQREHAANVIQRKWKEYKAYKESAHDGDQREDAAAEVKAAVAKNQEEEEAITDDASNGKFTGDGLKEIESISSVRKEEKELSISTSFPMNGGEAEANETKSKNMDGMEEKEEGVGVHESESFESYSLMEGNAGLREKQQMSTKGSVNTFQESLSGDIVQVDPGVIFRTILRATSAHLKRLELLAARNTSSSSQ